MDSITREALFNYSRKHPGYAIRMPTFLGAPDEIVGIVPSDWNGVTMEIRW